MYVMGGYGDGNEENVDCCVYSFSGKCRFPHFTLKPSSDAHRNSDSSWRGVPLAGFGPVEATGCVAVADDQRIALFGGAEDYGRNGPCIVHFLTGGMSALMIVIHLLTRLTSERQGGEEQNALFQRQSFRLNTSSLSTYLATTTGDLSTVEDTRPTQVPTITHGKSGPPLTGIVSLDDDLAEEQAASEPRVHQFTCHPLKLCPIIPRHPASHTEQIMTPSPFPLEGHSAFAVPGSELQIVIFGGAKRGVDKATNTVHLVTVQDGQMSISLVETDGPVPPPRTEHASALVGRVLVVHGGFNERRHRVDQSLYFLDIGQ